MKTTLLIAALSLGTIFTTKAQTLYSNDFTAAAGLSVIDYDGDGNQWGLFAGSATTVAWGLTGDFAGSRSWSSTLGPLTPDNFLFTTNAINIPSNLLTTFLSFKLGATDPVAFQENISVYLVPGASTSAQDILTYCEENDPVFNLTLGQANSRTAITQKIDVSSFAGSAVKIIFRHHDCTDMNIIYIDDILLNQEEVLATASFNALEYAVSPNPAKDVISIASKFNGQISAVSFTDLNGRVVKQNTVNNLSKVELNISDLSAGVYMMNISSDRGASVKKIIKN